MKIIMDNVKNTNVFAAYEKAIEGYQFQVGRYNTWMNYYALFVGALFVALYSVGTGCCKDSTDGIMDVKILLTLISFIGWIASFCWYGALLGYRKWNDHWMDVIKKKEKKLTEYSAVYAKMPTSNKSGRRFAAGYISTQKITGVFVICVILAWTFISGYVVYSWVGGFDMGTYIGMGVILGLTALFFFLLHKTSVFCSSVPKSSSAPEN